MKIEILPSEREFLRMSPRARTAMRTLSSWSSRSLTERRRSIVKDRMERGLQSKPSSTTLQQAHACIACESVTSNETTTNTTLHIRRSSAQLDTELVGQQPHKNMRERTWRLSWNLCAAGKICLPMLSISRNGGHHLNLMAVRLGKNSAYIYFSVELFFMRLSFVNAPRK